MMVMQVRWQQAWPAVSTPDFPGYTDSAHAFPRALIFLLFRAFARTPTDRRIRPIRDENHRKPTRFMRWNRELPNNAKDSAMLVDHSAASFKVTNRDYEPQV